MPGISFGSTFGVSFGGFFLGFGFGFTSGFSLGLGFFFGLTSGFTSGFTSFCVSPSFFLDLNIFLILLKTFLLLSLIPKLGIVGISGLPCNCLAVP